MTSHTATLKDLHRLHQQLQDAHQELNQGPKRIRAHQRIVQSKRENADASKTALTELKMAADHKTLQLKTNEAKIAELRGKLNSAASNREFDIIKSQIEADTMANSVLEDEILEFFDRLDNSQQSLNSLEAECQSVQNHTQELVDAIEQRRPVLAARVESLDRDIAVGEKTIPSDVMEAYRRLVQAHGADALAAIVDGVCTACHEILSPQVQVHVNLGKSVFCRSCGRLIYLLNEKLTVEDTSV
jgi:predicted  nucleic acid-binding Zn-ribbon protein